MNGVDNYPMMREPGWPPVFYESVLGDGYTPPAPPLLHFPIIRNPFSGNDLSETQSAAVIAGGFVLISGAFAFVLSRRKAQRVSIRTNKRSSRLRAWGKRKS